MLLHLRTPGLRQYATSAVLQDQARSFLGFHARQATLAYPVRINVHGRHVTVTDPLERHVKDKLKVVLDKFKGAEYLEGEGGLQDVDVRLMNSQVTIKAHPRVQNKAMHDTFLRMGELKVVEAGADVYDSLDKAVLALEKKLRKYGRPAPLKMDYSRRSR